MKWYLVFGIYLFGLTHGQGHQIAQKRQETSGCREKKGKKHKTKQKSGAGIQPPDAQIAHIPAFRSITEIHRNTPSLRGYFYSHQGGRPTSTSPRSQSSTSKKLHIFSHTQTTLNSETHPTKPLQTKEQQNNIRRIHVAIVQSNSKKINNHPFPPPSVVHYQSYTERARPHLGHLLLLAKTVYSHLWQYQSSYLTPARSP